MNEYCQNVLKTELAKSDYDGKTADQGWAWLMEPYATESTKVNPVVDRRSIKTWAMLHGKLGVIQASDSQAAKTLMMLFSDPDFTSIDTSSDVWKALMGQLVTAGLLTESDVIAVSSLNSTKTTSGPKVRFDERFFPELWPHVSKDGNVGSPDDPAISGFPNTITREEFDKSWPAAGRA
jgi:hypothetical protein